MGKYASAFLATAVPMLVGCGAIVTGGIGSAANWPQEILPIALR